MTFKNKARLIYTNMETSRLQTTLNDVENRVEELREHAISIQKERESLLELLQIIQDNTDRTALEKSDRDDFEWQLERLIIRCLTVDVSVATPRNEAQEDAFKKVTDILERLQVDIKKDSEGSEKRVESYLNASLPEPLSGNINHKFQEKLLSCTIDDQKVFRRKLQRMYSEMRKSSDSMVYNGGAMTNEEAQNSYETVTNGDIDVQENCQSEKSTEEKELESQESTAHSEDTEYTGNS